MGLFQHKKEPAEQQPPVDATTEAVEQLLDDEFREELRSRARTYFDRVINENADLFKQDLDATVAHINTELKQHAARQLDEQLEEITRANTELKDHVTKQFDERFNDYDKTIKEAQGLALQTLNRSAQDLREQHQRLAASIEKSISDQENLMSNVFQGNMTRIIATKDAQDVALKSLNDSAKALQQQYEQVAATLQQSVANQENLLVTAFQDNMARVVEHYLLGALGDQYDMKAQLPSIIKQMEANKKAIVDDISL